MINSKQRQVISRCQDSVTFFLRNFVKTKHTSAGVIPFRPFKYQVKALKAFRNYRFVIFRKCRQSGVSKISGAFALWFAMFFSHKTVLIVSRRDEDAVTFLSENVAFPFRHLPLWMQDLWDPSKIKNNEHEIQFPNGSKIKSLTSHPDVLRSNSSSLNIIDEAAFIRDMSVMWSAGYPTLQHGGCLSPDSLISTQTGIERITDLRGGYTVKTDNSNERITDIYTNGTADTLQLMTSDGYYIESTPDHKFRVLDESGYIWRKAQDLNTGDYLVLSARPFKGGVSVVLDRQIFNNHSRGCRCCGCDYDEQLLRKLSSDNIGLCASCLTTQRMVQSRLDTLDCSLDLDLAEFLGILVGDGFYDKQGRFGISCDRRYQDFIAYLHRLIEVRFGAKARDEITANDWSVRFNHKALSLLLRHNDIIKRSSRLAFVPQCILRAKSHIRCAFLRGLFEADGSISKHYVTVSSSSWRLVHQVQVMLLDFGIRSRLKVVTRKNGFSKNPQYVLRLKTIKDVVKFRTVIGFLSIKKSDRLATVKDTGRYHKDRYRCHIDEFYQSSRGLPNKIRQHILSCCTKNAISRWLVYDLARKYKQLASTTLGKLALDELFADDLVSIQAGRCETHDLTVEPSHCYIANGFVSHNSVIIVSTTCGVGDWYWSAWTDAEAGLNDFHPIMINWWDMDWTISYKDALSGRKKSISPTADIRKCTTPEEIDKYGPFWSPWLEEQYRALQERGEAWKFKQEILADFVGSGNTIVDPRVLLHLETCIDDEFKTIKGEQPYVHPVKQQHFSINFLGNTGEPRPGEGLRVWRPPNYGTQRRAAGNRIIDPGMPAHRYTMGVDIATGKGRDYFAAEVFDVDEAEQVAELMVHTLPRMFKFMVDYLGRWYNNAMMVVERNNGGDAFIDELRYELMYPNLWRKKDINDKPSTTTRKQAMQVAAYGFMTTLASKPKLNKLLIDNLRVDETGWKIYSRRLVKQLQIYVRKRDRAGRDTNKTEAEDGPGNFDDLVISTGLAFVGIHDAIATGNSGLVPFMPNTGLYYTIPQEPPVEDKITDLIERVSGADSAFLMPMTGIETVAPDLSIMAELQRFTEQVGAIPIAQSLPSVSAKKHGFGKQ